MLVLTRRPGESIVIGNNIRLTIISLGPGRVKVGIEAPPDVRVDRAEIHAKILQEQAADVLAAVAQEAARGDDPISGLATSPLGSRTEIVRLTQRKPH